MGWLYKQPPKHVHTDMPTRADLERDDVPVGSVWQCSDCLCLFRVSLAGRGYLTLEPMTPEQTRAFYALHTH